MTHRRGDFHLDGEIPMGDGVKVEVTTLSSVVELDLNLRFEGVETPISFLLTV